MHRVKRAGSRLVELCTLRETLHSVRHYTRAGASAPVRGIRPLYNDSTLTIRYPKGLELVARVENLQPRPGSKSQGQATTVCRAGSDNCVLKEWQKCTYAQDCILVCSRRAASWRYTEVGQDRNANILIKVQD